MGWADVFAAYCGLDSTWPTELHTEGRRKGLITEQVSVAEAERAWLLLGKLGKVCC